VETPFFAQMAKKTPQKHRFLRFFPLQAIPLSRIIGLTKEEIQHFRVVLFYTCCGSERANVQFSSQIKKRI